MKSQIALGRTIYGKGCWHFFEPLLPYSSIRYFLLLTTMVSFSDGICAHDLTRLPVTVANRFLSVKAKDDLDYQMLLKIAMTKRTASS